MIYKAPLINRKQVGIIILIKSLVCWIQRQKPLYAIRFHHSLFIVFCMRSLLQCFGRNALFYVALLRIFYGIFDFLNGAVPFSYSKNRCNKFATIKLHFQKVGQNVISICFFAAIFHLTTTIDCLNIKISMMLQLSFCLRFYCLKNLTKEEQANVHYWIDGDTLTHFPFIRLILSSNQRPLSMSIIHYYYFIVQCKCSLWQNVSNKCNKMKSPKKNAFNSNRTFIFVVVLRANSK